MPFLEIRSSAGGAPTGNLLWEATARAGRHAPSNVLNYPTLMVARLFEALLLVHRLGATARGI